MVKDMSKEIHLGMGNSMVYHCLEWGKNKENQGKDNNKDLDNLLG